MMCTVTVPTAFLPSELRAMGATNFVTGVAFAISPFASFVSGPVAGALCASMGPSTVLLAGVLLEGWSAILSGYVHVLCDEDRNRIVIFIIWRLLQVRFPSQGSASSKDRKVPPQKLLG